MDFQVSARKWRPQKFGELIGQEHIVRTLTNAIELDRVSHAYLFSGTRGVGKTTTARILAKAINCENGPATEPCDQCGFCSEIKSGNCIDVREIDGASNNSVAEVRDLIETIQYAASACRYKVYIIDEVHMLSRSAFNALLKTLEEPPPNVVFIFATTELSKIPETILSRCQCFEFKPLSHKQIVQQLELICEQENIQADGLSLEEIAKTGTGSMRDAQSLLDQVIAYCGKTVGAGSVEEVLGIVGRQTLETFIDHLIQRDGAGLIEQIQKIATEGKDLNFFCRDLAEYLRHLLMVKLSDKPERILDVHICNLEMLQKQAEAFHADELQQMFTVLARTESEMKRSPMAQMVFEMSVLRLVDVRPFQKIDEMIQKVNAMERDNKSSADPIAGSPNPVSTTLPASPAGPSSLGNPVDSSSDWDRICQVICEHKPMFDHYLSQCKVLSFNESGLSLGFADPVTLERIQDPENLQVVIDAVKTVCGSEIKIELSLNENKNSPESGADTNSDKKKVIMRRNESRQKTEAEIIQDALDVFGGVVIR